MDNVFVNGGLKPYGEKWNKVAERKFNAAEIAAVKKTEVVERRGKNGEDYGLSVSFLLVNGTVNYIPVSTQGNQPNLGEAIDMDTAKLVTLARTGGANILKVEL